MLRKESNEKCSTEKGFELPGETGAEEAGFAARTHLLVGRELLLSRENLKYIILAFPKIPNVNISLI